MPGKECPGRNQPTGADSHDANTLNVGSGVTTGDEVPMTLDEILRSLGWQDGEFTAVCHKPVGGQFSSSVVESAKATARVESLAAQAGPRIIRVDLDEVESLFRPIPTAACWGR